MTYAVFLIGANQYLKSALKLKEIDFFLNFSFFKTAGRWFLVI